ncbi:MAG: hypothetical protein KDJ52_18955 [Anaerolineae bacterium]|nr:hypothetical protein [Anaerolineae bacterium]
MDTPGDSSSSISDDQNNTWNKVDTALQTIQVHCNQLLSHYNHLTLQQAITLIEAIEIQNFVLQELFSQMLPPSPSNEKRDQQE